MSELNVSVSGGASLELEREDLERRFKLNTKKCYYCGICEPLCPVFTPMFELQSREYEEGESLHVEDFKEIIDLCYYCKLCLVACGIGVDLPRLMLESKIYFVRQHGQTLQNRLLMNTELVGKLASRVAPLANAMLSNSLNRRLMEAVVGIDRRRTFPTVHSQTFPRWMRRHLTETRGRAGSDRPKVALFSGCFTDYYDPQVGIAAVQVLERNRAEIVYPDQRCCGIPMLSDGSLDAALENFRYNVAALAPLAREGYDIVVLSTPCSMTFKQEYVQFLDTDEARLVARHVYDVSYYLFRLHQRGRLDTDFQEVDGRLAYHVPCAARAQRIETAAVELLKLVPGLEVEVIDQGCCGFDGSFGFKQQYFDIAMEVGKRLFAGIEEAGVAETATDCPLCEVQIRDGAGVRTVHPVEVLKRAYGL